MIKEERTQFDFSCDEVFEIIKKYLVEKGELNPGSVTYSFFQDLEFDDSDEDNTFFSITNVI